MPIACKNADQLLSPGTAILFSLTIVEAISGKEKRDEVAGPMVLSAAL